MLLFLILILVLLTFLALALWLSQASLDFCYGFGSVSLSNETGEGKEVMPEKISNDGGHEIEANGSRADDENQLDSAENGSVYANALLADNRGENVENGRPEDSIAVTGKSPATAKGYGLRKWRRLKKDVVKNFSAVPETNKALKRGLSLSAEQRKPVASATKILQNCKVLDNSSDSEYAVGSALVTGADSENSEDRSIMSSTAASAPKMRYDLPAVMGKVAEENGEKSVTERRMDNLAQQIPLGRGKMEDSKKPGGERVKIEKENSHSSMESDWRSSNFVFMQGTFTVNGSGIPSGRSMDYDGENSDEPHAPPEHFGGEVEAPFGKENNTAVEDIFQGIVSELSPSSKEERDEIQHSSTRRDPLVESIISLQSVQHALEKEIDKYREIEKETLHSESSAKGEPSSSNKMGSEETGQSSRLEAQLLSLTEKVKHLETELTESRAILQAKESRVAELETSINFSKLPREESGSTTECPDEEVGEIESEIEILIEQKMKAEVEYLVIKNCVEKGDEITLLEAQKTLAEEQALMGKKLKEAESKAAVLNEQVQEAERNCDGVLKTEEAMKMQRRACKVSSFLFIQLVLLSLLLWVLVLPKLPPSGGVVSPT